MVPGARSDEEVLVMLCCAASPSPQSARPGLDSRTDQVPVMARAGSG